MPEPTEPNNNSNNNSPTNAPDSSNSSTVPPITLPTPLNQVVTEPGLQIVNQQDIKPDGTVVTHTTFNTTDNTLDPQITEDLIATVDAYYDDTNSENIQLVNQIKDYAGKINCSDFHGKGTIDDYSELFKAAAKIANETKQIQLDVDTEGFSEFGAAADELSALFTSFIIKLQNVSIINDLDFLRSITSALQKIYNLSETFGKFKQTILATTTVTLPKSAHDAKIALEGVIGEVNCAMKYITNFVSPSAIPLVDAELSDVEKNVINKAVSTIENWNTLSDQGVSIAMSNSPDIMYIKQAGDILKTNTTALSNATSALRAKFALYNITH